MCGIVILQGEGNNVNDNAIIFILYTIGTNMSTNNLNLMPAFYFTLNYTFVFAENFLIKDIGIPIAL